MSFAVSLQRAVGRCKTARKALGTAPHINDMSRSGNGATSAALRRNEGIFFDTETGGTAYIFVYHALIFP